MKAFVTGLLLILCLFSLPLETSAKAGFFAGLIRKSANVGDDIPLHQADEVAARLARSGIGEEFLENSARKSGKMLDGMDDAARKALRAREAKRILQAMSGGLDPKFVRQLDNLDDAGRATGLMLANGSQTLTRNVPDIAMRGRLLKTGGTDMVAAIGLHGDDLAHTAMRLDAVLDAGTIIVPAGKRIPTLADLGKAMTRFGHGSKQFWDRFVKPHWKIWLASGALTAYLLNPEDFQNAAGELTAVGFQHLTELAGVAAAGAVRGISNGSGHALESVTRSVTDNLLSSWYNIAGFILFIMLISLFFRRVRYYAFAPIRWLMRTPKEDKPGENWWH